MNLSMKWLSDYVDVDVTPREFSEAMTMSGSKVEGYEIEGEEISKVVVGKYYPLKNTQMRINWWFVRWKLASQNQSRL